MHRKVLVQELRSLHSKGKNVLLVGEAGIGKSRLLLDIGKFLPLQICTEASSLGRICNSLEHHLSWNQNGLNLVERKNRLLNYLKSRGQTVAFDDVAKTPPQVARFIARLTNHLPVWIACRSDRCKEIGHVWSYLYNFTRIEVPALTIEESSILIENAVASGTVQPDASRHCLDLHRLSGGIPRILEDLLTELAARKYRIDGSFGLRLLDLDRRIRGLGGADPNKLAPKPQRSSDL
jgi:hypothetical protein